MKTTVTRNDFHDAFQCRPDNFSYAGLDALFEYFERYESNLGEEIELDPIAICCEYTEAAIADVLEDYNLDTLDDLLYNTMVIPVDDETVIYLAFWGVSVPAHNQRGKL